MELVFELLFQFVFEVVGDVLFETGFRRTARVARSRVGRLVIAVAAGFGAGLWWGARLSERGRVDEPRSLWISLALAVVFGLGALWRWRRGRPAQDPHVVSPPWRWPLYRLAGFAVLNLAVAAGIAVGFNPHPLR